MELDTQQYDGLNRRNAGYIFTRYSNGVPVSESYNKMPHYIQINLTKAKKA